MAAKLLKQIPARYKAVIQMISLDAARRTVAQVAFQRDDYARPVETFRNFRGRQPNHASMPAVSGNYGRVRLDGAIRAVLEFFHGAIKDLALGFHALAIARIEMFRQTARCFLFCRLEQLDDRARGVHSPGSIDPRPDAKPEVVSGHLGVVSATGNVD